MIAAEELAGGFADPVFNAQAVFRAVLEAMARPGTLCRVEALVAPPAPLNPAAGAVLCALADADTPLWLDTGIAEASAVGRWLRFHTGAPLTEDPASAAFAVIGDAEALPDFASFAQGTAEYPDRSCTLVLQVRDIRAEPGSFVLTGPGIDGSAPIAVEGLPADFAARWAENRRRFPLGVDVVLAAPDCVAALPRSVRIAEREGAACM